MKYKETLSTNASCFAKIFIRNFVYIEHKGILWTTKRGRDVLRSPRKSTHLRFHLPHPRAWKLFRTRWDLYTHKVRTTRRKGIGCFV